MTENYFVYRFLDKSSTVVYVGKTRQALEKRISVHFGNSGHLSKEQISQVERVEYLELSSRLEMDIVELYYINKLKPAFNVQSKYEEEFLLDDRRGDVWRIFDPEQKDDVGEGISTPSKLRVEVVLSEVDIDIIEYLEERRTPRATQFKEAIRAQMINKENERLDERIKRLIGELVPETRTTSPEDYKRAWELEKAEKERIALELAELRESLRRLVA